MEKQPELENLELVEKNDIEQLDVLIDMRLVLLGNFGVRFVNDPSRENYDALKTHFMRLGKVLALREEHF